MIEQAEVELANRHGRLHPSQRGKLLDLNFWVAAVLVVAGLVVAVLLAAVAETAAEVLGTLVPILAITAWFAFVCRRRLADVRSGQLVATTGWTHDFGRQRPEGDYPIALSTRLSQGYNEHFYLKAGGRTYPLERKLRERIRPEQVNTVLIAPRSKLLINVLPA
ncbi:hypothetical protein Amsp01_054610 [Amycolatopsis sp. NBRC 101858]|uniref:hypothetical protein n=1 Tax=Amycolatopsis sp. NBRC 101858 TaxID=3032200 RepID=UPI0024A35548|nr:hypothetical protein [Amycolatopsis sp. NBRC 101858]GLY39437.1 hypothetical protein Amsp01_054610 [Amycolatopsis sp. NBRC 101858]